jgi:hypothetical protein
MDVWITMEFEGGWIKELQKVVGGIGRRGKNGWMTILYTFKALIWF